MDKIAVLIPCYNEEATIGKVIADFREALPDAVIYVYDNNSSDRTGEIALNSGAVVRKEHQQGKGNVIRRMFREIDAEAYLIVDGDDTYPAQAAPEMIRKVMENSTDMVVGDRLSSTYYEENKRMFHNFGNSLVRWIINHLFHCDFTDIMTGYRAFSYQFVKSYPVQSYGFEIETEMTIHSIEHHMQTETEVIQYRDRPAGSQSKLNTYSDGFKVLVTIMRLYAEYHPLAFYSFIAMLLALMGFVFLVPVLSTYVYTGLVPRFPTLIVSGFIILTAILMLVTGVILQNLLAREKKQFEYRLYEIYNRKLSPEKE